MASHIKQNGRLTLSAVAIAVAIGIPSMCAASTDMYDGNAWAPRPELSDVALDSMRGRFVSGNQILFFGVEMYTEWRTALGDTHTAALNIGIDRSGGFVRPTITLLSRTGSSSSAAAVSGGGSSYAGTPSRISSGGLDQVKGVGQVIQVTGNYNGITNVIGVDIDTERPQGYDKGADAGTGNSESLDATTGTVAQTYVMNNNAGVRVSVPGQGLASQSIRDVTGLQQMAQVYGSLNHINNRLNLSIQLQSLNTVPAMTLHSALQSMRGLSVAGMF